MNVLTLNMNAVNNRTKYSALCLDAISITTKHNEINVHSKDIKLNIKFKIFK